MNNLTIDREKFLLFCKTLQPEATQFVFQTFTDCKANRPKGKTRDPLALSFVSTAEAAIPRLERVMQQGAGVFMQVNYGIGRGKDKITQLSSYFLDTDGAPIEPIVKEMPMPLILVTSSTGNYHIYWRTNDPLEKYRDTQKYLAQCFACDESMINLDRVCRVPGTYHLKDPENPVFVDMQTGDDFVYEAKDLIKCAPAPRATSAAPDAPTMNALDAMIVTGEHFELPEELPEGNRTQHLVAYAGQLVAQGYGEESVRTMVREAAHERLPEGQQPITDESFEMEIFPAIRKFVLKAGGQTMSAPPVPAEAVPSGWTVPDVPEQEVDDLCADAYSLLGIETFLENFYLVEKGQRVVHLEKSGTLREYKVDEFKTSYGNIKREGKKLPVLWLENKNRKTVYDVQYYPGRELTYTNHRGQRLINNYVGPDLIKVDEPHVAHLQPFFDHIKYLFPRTEDFTIFMNWLAMTVQHPDRRIIWAPVVISKTKGIGKGWVFQLLRKLCGEHNCAMIMPDSLASAYNEYMFEKTVVLIDEIKLHGKNQFDTVNKVKTLITEPTADVNIKFGAKGTYPTFVNFLCFTNHMNAIPIEDEDRRFWVVKCDAVKQPDEYYNKLWNWLRKTDGPAHVYQYLMNMDLSDWNADAAPEWTEAKSDMAESFRSEIDIVLSEAIEDRTGSFAADVIPMDVMEEYVKDALGMDRLSKGDKHQIRLFINDKCHKPDRNRTRVWATYSNKREKKRPVIVRNEDRWETAETADLVNEMERAWRASLTGQIAGNLQSVEN